MVSLFRPYTRSFYERFETGSLSSAEIILPIVFDVLRPKSVLDFGCGVGTWLAAARTLGANRLVGYDGKWVKRDMLADGGIDFHEVDLEADTIDLQPVDLAMCLEVAEHLSPRASERLIADLCKCSNTVLFSAAIPGQGGAHHINEQWQSHWISLFNRLSFTAYDVVRPAVWDDLSVEVWYAQNCFLFVSQDDRDLSARLSDHRVLISDMVHPRLLTQKIFHPNAKDEMRALAALPRAAWGLARRWV